MTDAHVGGLCATYRQKAKVLMTSIIIVELWDQISLVYQVVSYS